MLFRRARWWRLEAQTAAHANEETRSSFTVPKLHGGQYTATARAPVLVLFEFDAALRHGRRATSQPDLLATGFLLVDVFFPHADAAPDLDDVLAFNEIYRYWQEPFAGHAARYQGLLAALPVEPFGESSPTTGQAEEVYTRRWTSLLELCVRQDRDRHWRLYPQAWARNSAQRLKHPMTAVGPGWAVYADSRTFVWTCVLLEDGLAALEERFGKGPAAAHGHWIKLLNVDRAGSRPQDRTGYEEQWARSRTYERWAEAGTVYGFTYHSGAMLASPQTDPPLWRHFGGMYFDQALLLLYLRVTSFRFSQALARITGEARDGTARSGDDAWLEKFQALRRDFVFFTNLYQFPLISNQQQGLEMYTLARQALEVNELFSEVQQEVQSTHDYFQTEAAQELTDLNTRLAVGAGIGLPFALATGFLGMNLLASAPGEELLRLGKPWTAGLALVLTLVLFMALILGFMRWPGWVRRFILPARKTRTGRRR